MVLKAVLALLLCITGVSATCRPQENETYCYLSTVYIHDISSDMNIYANCDTEIDFVKDKIAPKLHNGNGANVTSLGYNSAAFIGYGAGPSSEPLSSDYVNVCFQIELLRTMADGNGLQQTTLLDTMKAVAQYYNTTGSTTFTLFSRSNNTADIQATADFVRKNFNYPDYYFVVVVLWYKSDANPAWDSFPAKNHFYVPVDKLYTTPDLDNCIIDAHCDHTYGVVRDYYDGDYNCTFPDYGGQTTKSPPVTPNPGGATTPRNGGQTNPTTDSHGYYNLNGPGCECNPETSYNDIMVVVDKSKGMTDVGLMMVLATAAGQLGQFNVQLASAGNVNSSTRVGLVSYASKATLVNGLGTMDAAAVANMPFSVKLEDDQYTNVNEGLSLAMAELTGPNHRSTSRRVILLLASDYFDDGFPNPMQTSEQFQNNLDGVLIVYEYLQEFGVPSPDIAQLASPGYFLNNVDNTDGTEITQAFCDANCFCQVGLEPFELTTDRKLPTSGCYKVGNTPTTYDIARQVCKNSYGGDLSTDRTKEKSDFLVRIANSTNQNQQFIGLQYDVIAAQWMWTDGQALNPSYTVWYGGTAPGNVGNNKCVLLFPPSLGADPIWMNTACSQNKRYVCEMHPADSTHFFNVQL